MSLDSEIADIARNHFDERLQRAKIPVTCWCRYVRSPQRASGSDLPEKDAIPL